MTGVVDPTDARSRVGQLSDERRAVLMRRLAAQRSGRQAGPAAPRPRPPGAADLTVECSPTQRRVWLAAGLSPDSPGLHVTTAIRLSGPLDVAALQRAVSTVVARHDGLRTVADDSTPVVRQRVRADATVEVRRVDLAGGGQTAVVEALRRERFDLRRGPLLRVALLRRGDDDHVLVLVGHHFVMDGGSMGIVVRELAAVYTAVARRSPVPLPAHAVQYPDVSAWQWDLLRDGRLDRSLDYWRAVLAGVGEPLDLPLPRPGTPPERTVGVHPFRIDGAAARPGGPGGLAPGLLAVFTVLLARYTGRWDQTVGMFVAGRTRAETAGVVGNFTNLVAVRTDLTDRPAFAEAAVRVRVAFAGALAHQDAPFETVVATAGPPRVVGRPPLVQVAVNLHNHAYQHAAWHGLGAEVLPVSADHDDLDLTLVAVPQHTGTVDAAFEYPADRFAPEAVAALGRHLTTLGAALYADQGRRVSAAPMLPADELETLRAWGRGPGA
ncbi:condensation domain-containing protein [Virgisporangium ochraceum]|uniref:Condensation domain-containing protein n=1 Tax=Virgisporangium ochraceum TaxID=65505 RepID=A0A8J4EGM0_9ACTN|nr:condensation domain-containing protein [Virgisporangium ochraceum]GIJ73871.1 hypothetical protein Voc01_087880 [Virgisporangium ochraceum]